MEGKSFAKLTKDCQLIDKKLTAADVDLIFAKIKKPDRKIGFPEFIDGLTLLSQKKGVPQEELAYFIATSNQGPILKATKAD